MFIVIIIMLSGTLLGWLIRRHHISWINKIIIFFIWFLLFLLGVEVGENDKLVKALPKLGLQSLFISIGGLLGSLLGAKVLWLTIKKKNNIKENPSDEVSFKHKNPFKGSLIIVSFFILGYLTGYFKIINISNNSNGFSFYVLGCLMFCVGFNIGNDPDTFKKFRSLNPRLMLLPIITIVGTLLGSALIGLFLANRSLRDCLAIGSGMGYYSLSSILITEYRGVELGTIALLCNICREIITLVMAPFFVKWFGRLAPITAGGATTMDTTLPIIAQTSGQEYVILSIFHGFITDFSVPFLITFFCSL